MLPVDSLVCFCIPARLESSRLPKKLLLPLGEQLCIQRTVSSVSRSKYFNDNIIVFADDPKIQDCLRTYPCRVILTTLPYTNGTERIARNLYHVDEKYTAIVNIQADEPFVSPRNIDFCIDMHLQRANHVHGNIFYTTLHEERNSAEYLQSTSSIKVVTDADNHALYYSRNVIPWNKHGRLDETFIYKTFTGIYVFDRDMIASYPDLSPSALQVMEDCEQLRILESGYKIKSFPTIEYNEISLNTPHDYEYLLHKYHTSENPTTIEHASSSLLHLDCTLRDGGYVNNWQFSQEFITNYVAMMDRIGIDYVEIGFVNQCAPDEKDVGIARHVTKEYIRSFQDRCFKICVMGDYGHVNMDSLQRFIGVIHLVRIAFHRAAYKEAIEQCVMIKDMGFDVSANIMAITSYTTDDILNVIRLVNQTSIDMVYIADSYGGLHAPQLQHLIEIFQNHLLHARLGIHLHNNMNNAYHNFFTIKSAEIPCIVDSTLFGMGRGAGNLQTELIMFPVLDPATLSGLLTFIDVYIKGEGRSVSWGYDIDYLYAGLLNIHPNYIVHLRQKGASYTCMLMVLHQVVQDGKHTLFDVKYFRGLLVNFSLDKG